MSISDRLEAVRGPVGQPEEEADNELAPTREEGAEPAVDPFAPVKSRAVETLFERIGSRVSDSSLTEDQLHGFVRDELTTIVEGEQLLLNSDERRRLIQDIEDDAIGLGPLQRLLDDESVTEIMVNTFDQVFIERRGRLVRSATTFRSEQHLRRIIERIVGKVGRRIDESSPLVDARLLDGSRVNAVVPPLAVDGSSLTIRKFSTKPLESTT